MNLEQGGKEMEKYDGLEYQWQAQMADGTEVSQYDENGENEVLFKDVKEKDIAVFWLMNTKTKEKEFAVSLTSGKFYAFGKWIIVANGDEILTDRETLKYRLIYFRQVTRVFAGMSGTQLKCSKVFFIGWQANEPETGKNIKKMMQVINPETIGFG